MMVIFGGVFCGFLGTLALTIFSVCLMGKGVTDFASWIRLVISGDWKAERKYYKEMGKDLRTYLFYHDPNWQYRKKQYDLLDAQEKLRHGETLDAKSREILEDAKREERYMDNLRNW